MPVPLGIGNLQGRFQSIVEPRRCRNDNSNKTRDLPPLILPLVKLESTKSWPRGKVPDSLEHCAALFPCFTVAVLQVVWVYRTLSRSTDQRPKISVTQVLANLHALRFNHFCYFEHLSSRKTIKRDSSWIDLLLGRI